MEGKLITKTGRVFPVNLYNKLEAKLKENKSNEAQPQQQMQQAQMQRQQNGGLDMQTAQAVIQRAQQDAARDSGQTMGANAPV